MKQQKNQTRKIAKGHYQMLWNGKLFTIKNLRGEVDGQLTWYIDSNDLDISDYTDQLWYTKSEAIETIKYQF